MRKQLLIMFRIVGDLCALSHRETLTMWQRILVRCHLPLVYSRGFNPRPRISLPLPRAVGLQSDEELLCAEITADQAEVPMEELSKQIGSCLPAGCEVTEIRIAEGTPHFKANKAEYLIERSEAISPQRWEERLDQCSQEIASGNSILLCRNTPKHKSKRIDLRDFVEEITGNQDELRIRCRIDSTGSVRLEELLEWLRIGPADLARPPRRTAVKWIRN